MRERPAAVGDSRLIVRLREWRLAQAREQGVPAYVILHDRTLAELAAQRPASAQELLAVPGIGVAKAERYGAALLAVVATVDPAAGSGEP